MNCATSCINVAVGGHDCFTNRHLVNRFAALYAFKFKKKNLENKTKTVIGDHLIL